LFGTRAGTVREQAPERARVRVHRLREDIPHPGGLRGGVGGGKPIGNAVPTTTGFDEYAGEHIRVWDSKGLEPGEREEEFAAMLTKFLRKRRETPNLEEHVHLVWYAIQAPGARVTGCDLRLLTETLASEHVIVVLTKADIVRTGQIEAMRCILVGGGITPERIIPTSDRKGGAMGCRELVELSHALLPAACRDSFLEAQRIDREAKERAVLAKRGKAGVSSPPPRSRPPASGPRPSRWPTQPC